MARQNPIPEIRKIPLDTALTDEAFSIESPDGFSVIRVDAPVEIKINDQESPAFPATVGKWCGNVSRIYVTNEAFAGAYLWIAIPRDGLTFRPSAEGGSVGGRYEAAPTTISDGQTKPFLIDSEGRLFIRLADRLDSTLDSVAIEAGSNPIQITDDGNAVLVESPLAVTSIENSSVAAALTTSLDIGERHSVTIIAESATNGDHYLEVSDDNSNWHILEVATGSTNIKFSGVIGARYVRCRSTSAVDNNHFISAKA